MAVVVALHVLDSRQQWLYLLHLVVAELLEHHVVLSHLMGVGRRMVSSLGPPLLSQRQATNMSLVELVGVYIHSCTLYSRA